MILRKPKDRFTAYRQLVLGVSAFDIVSSTAYMLVSVLAPYDAGFYLSRGNETTCKIQGFLIQLGQSASMLYNMFLSLYFYLVIVHGWREHRFKKVALWVHVAVGVCGVSLAIGTIPFIEAQFGVCGILPPLTSSQWQVSLFYTTPVSIVLFTLTASTAGICRKVYMQQQRARKWKLSNGRVSIMREVLWQSFWYVMAFYVTLPMMLVSFYAPFEYPRGFWIFIVTAFLAPLQGLMNALVYFHRTKVWQSWRKMLQCGRLLGRMTPWGKQKNGLSSSAESVECAEHFGAPVTDRNSESGVGSVVVARPQPIPSTQLENSSSGAQQGEQVGESKCAVEQGTFRDSIKSEASSRSRYAEYEGVIEFWSINESGSRPLVLGS